MKKIKFVCQQCGKPLETKITQKCPHCNQITAGLAHKEFESLEKALGKLFKEENDRHE